MLARAAEIIMIVMALYGCICLISAFIGYIFSRTSHTKQKYELILTVKNQQDNIEDVIRSIFRDELFKNSGPDCKVKVIDKGSDDDTIKILNKLAREYENLEVVEELNGEGL